MSRFLNALSLALSQLRRNLSRSVLTSLGVLIGVAAVITMVGLGQGATASIEGDLASMGSNLLILQSGTGGGPQRSTNAPPFALADAAAIRSSVPYLAAVAPQMSASVTAVVGDAEWSTSVTGSNNDYLILSNWSLASGRSFTEGEERAGSPVCVLGETVRTNLFGSGDPTGASVRLGASTCTVIGVLDPKGANTMGMDQDNLVLAPIGFVSRRLVGNSDISTILLSVDRADHIDAASGTLDALMRARRHITGDSTVNFQIRDTREMAGQVTSILGVMAAFLSAVAAVSLLVGGIGIMNIMLVSVTERTREIGIRMSIGALEGDVMTQFLVEAVVLSGLGGALGAILGVGLTAIGASIMDIPLVVSPAVLVGAMLFSAGLGVGFGWVPARRAARLEPIDALRHT